MADFNYVIFFGVLIGIVAYVMLYIGKGIQKYAIEGLKVDKTIKSKHSGVWIGGHVTILKDTRIGMGALVAANTVVNKDVDQGTVVAGVPAKIIKSNC